MFRRAVPFALCSLLLTSFGWAQERTAPEIVTKRTLRLPHTGRELTAVKTFDPQTGESRVLAFENGVEVNAKQALAAEDEARFAALGNLLPSLASRLDDGTTGRIQVLMRLAMEEPFLDKSRIRSAADEAGFTLMARAAEERLVARAGALLDEKLARLGVEDARVLSRSGPFVAVELPAEAVRQLSRDRGIGFIGLYGEERINDAPTIPASLPTTRTDYMHSSGNKGAGVKIAVLEEGYPTLPIACFNIVALHDYSQQTDSHLTFSPGLIGNRYNNGACNGTWTGYAPEASVVMANSDSWVDSFEWAKNQGINVVTMSWHTFTEEINPNLSSRDIFFDYWTTQPPYPIVFTSAGNQAANDAYASGKGYNIMGVGNVLNDDEVDRCNDSMSPDSSFLDPDSPHSDREVPAIASPGSLVSLLGSTFGGTSAATPVTAAITADLLSRNPTLKSWPEATRAILLATANYQGADGQSWSKSAEGKDGTGMTNAYFAALAADTRETTTTPQFRAHDYGTLYNSSFSAGYLTKTWKAKVGSIPSRVRVALVWNSKVAATNGDPSSSVLDADLDLIVQAPNGTTVASSTSYDSSHEFVEFAPTVAGDYTIKVRGVTVPANFTRYYAVAWTAHYDICE